MTTTSRHTLSEWNDLAARLSLPSHLLIDGASAGAEDGATFDHVSPRNGSLLARVPSGTTGDLDRAIAAARRAFDDGPWPTMAPRERKQLMLRWADLIEEHRDELALMISLEMGKPVEEAWSIELRAVLATYRWYAELADKELDETSPVGPDDLALITREPVGVVGVVTPWNFPLTLAGWKIAPALAVGCTVVHKPSDLASMSALRRSVLGKHLGMHRDVDALAFTGSTEVGRAYLEYSARSNLKRTWLELGGKSGNIILPDAPDLEVAISTAAWGIFFNAGQMCTAPSRLIVHRDIADEVIAGVVARAADYAPGDPLDPATTMGPLASSARLADVTAHVERAREAGADPLVGGSAIAGEGSFFEPTVFADVHPDSRLAQEEVFGPVLAIVTVDSDAEAVRVANNSDYGLAAGLWTSDVSKVHRLSRQLRAGTVWVNCYEEGDLTVPFGGYKQSGNGRDKSRHAVDKYTELKTTFIHL
jgi:gamma-glutamyl-gamma-aminobutyraldehyde dehydrogenase